MPDLPNREQFRSQLESGPKIEGECAALERLAAHKQWDEWLRRCQHLVDSFPDGLVPAEPGRWIGLRRSLQQRFRTLPVAIQERYRRQYDGPAAAALEKALNAGEPAAVTRVYLQYRYTSSGPRALAWLAERAMDGGDEERAWLAFTQLLADANGAETDLARWMVKAIIAGDLSGHGSETAAIAERLTTRLGDRPLKIKGQLVRARDWVSQWRAGRRGDGAPGSSYARRSPTSGWPDFAGGPDAARVMLGAVGPDVRLGWQQVVPGAGVGLPDYFDRPRPRWGTPYRYPGVAPFSHLAFPTVSDGRVYAQSPGQICCDSLEDGNTLWSVRISDLAPQRQFPTPGGFRWWRPLRAMQTVPVAAGHLLLVRIPAGRYENDSSGWPAEFVLAALDSQTGALLWERSAAHGPPDSFYNLPTISGQTVYSGISTSTAGLTEYRAAALDAATGDRLWTTYLGAGSDPMGGVDGSPAAVRGGTVWVETCLHTICALDALTGEIQWMAAFQPDTNAPERSGWQDTMNVTNQPVSLIALVGDRLLFCPRWGDQLVALIARTGQRAWSTDNGHCHSLIAVDRAHAILAGDQIRSIDPATGKPEWTWVPQTQERLGYPCLFGNRVLVPGGASLTFLDLSTGEETGRRGLKEFNAQPGAATVLVLGRRLLFSQADRLIALDESPDQRLASRR
jgi:outer membrane protein assembly factor BamB